MFSAAGMFPGPKKVQVTVDRPILTSVTKMHWQLELALYYRRYIQHFSNGYCLIGFWLMCKFHLKSD